MGTLTSLASELGKAVKNDDAGQITKLLAALGKGRVKEKESLQKSGLAKQILRLQKVGGEFGQQAKKLIAQWKKQIEGDTPVQHKATGVKHRDSLRDKFATALMVVGELDEDLDQILEARAKDIAAKLEIAICTAFGPTSKEYGAKARSLLFNLQDRENDCLRLKLMAGALEPVAVVKMDTKELASESKKEQRLEIETANLQARRTDWAQEEAKKANVEGFFVCGKCGSKKTHYY